MFHRRIDEARGVAISHGKASAARPLTKRDGLGFSLSIVTGPAGGPHELWYKHHWEANYVIDGELHLEEVKTGRTWDLGPGAMYCVGPTDRHRVTAKTPMTVMSVFNPPIVGDETHDSEGTYPPTGTVPAGKPAMFVVTPQDLQKRGRAKTSVMGNAQLIRYLLKEDGLGFTWSDVRFKDGVVSKLWYRNHWEANYVFAGSGTIEHHGTGETLKLEPGVLYCVGPDDRHTLTTGSGLHLVSIFNPPLVGNELHDAEGGYPPTGPVPPGPGKA